MHWIRQDQYPTPSNSAATETSLVVRQFLELVRGERQVMKANLFPIEAVIPEKRYCMDCGGVHWFDIVRFKDRTGFTRLEICRFCGEARRA